MTLTISPATRWVDADDGTVTVLSPWSGRFHTFNKSGRLIWLALAEGLPMRAVEQRVMACYQLPEARARVDVNAFCERLLSLDLARMEIARPPGRATRGTGLRLTNVRLGGHAFAVHTLEETEAHRVWLKRVARESWEPELLEAMRSSLRPGDVMIDVGAWLGPYTLLASRLVGDTGTVFAIEPDPAAWAVLVANVRRNGCEHNVVMLDCALADVEGAVSLVEGPERADSNARIVPLTMSPRPRLAARTLESLCRSYGIRPDVVKIDAEGAEARILRGAGAALEQTRALFVECHRRYLAAEGVAIAEWTEATSRALGMSARVVQQTGETVTVVFDRAAGALDGPTRAKHA